MRSLVTLGRPYSVISALELHLTNHFKNSPVEALCGIWNPWAFLRSLLEAWEVLGFPNWRWLVEFSHTPLGALQNKVSRTNPRNHGPRKLEPTFITNFAKMTARQESSWLNYSRRKGEDGNVCGLSRGRLGKPSPATLWCFWRREGRRGAPWSNLAAGFPRWRKALAPGSRIGCSRRGSWARPRPFPGHAGNWSDSLTGWTFASQPRHFTAGQP